MVPTRKGIKSQMLISWVTQTAICNKYLELRGNIHLELGNSLRKPDLFHVQAATLHEVHTLTGPQGQGCLSGPACFSKNKECCHYLQP